MFRPVEPPLRPVRVGVPYRLLRWMQTTDGRLLRRLLTQPHVHVIVIPVGGAPPPSGFERVPHADQTRQAVENWALYEEIERRGRARLCVRSAAGDEPIEALLDVDDEPFKWNAGVPVDEPFELPTKEEGQVAAAFQTLVAKVLRCNLYITDAPDAVDLDGETGYRYPTEIITPEAAIPLLGLYLRGIGRYRLEAGRQIGRRQPVFPPVRSGEDVVMFFHTAARSMLWAVEDWRRLADQETDPAKGEEVRIFADSVLHRLEQLLRERDVLIRHLAVAPEGIGAGYLVGQSFDIILLRALAAVDAAAEVVNALFRLGFDRPMWGKDLLGKLSASAQGLNRLFDPNAGGQHYALWDSLKQLRNTIHSDALSREPRISVVGEFPGRILLPIPMARFAKVRGNFDGRMGGLERWGIYEGVHGSSRACLHPGEFVEELVPRVFALVHHIMVETLRGKGVPTNRPWGNRYGGPLSDGEEQSLRLLGLERVAYGA